MLMFKQHTTFASADLFLLARAFDFNNIEIEFYFQFKAHILY